MSDIKSIHGNPVADSAARARITTLEEKVAAIEEYGTPSSDLPAEFRSAMYTFLKHLTGVFDDANGGDYVQAVIRSMGYESDALPSSYQQVEYIESNGNQYIDTNISPGALPIRVEVGVYKASQATAEEAIVTATYVNTTSWEVGYNTTANRLFAYSNNSVYITNASVYGNAIDVTATFNASSPYKTLKVESDGSELTEQSTSSNTAGVGYASNKLHLFNVKEGTNKAKIRMYYCRIYSGETLTANFIPCYNKATGTVGMYDLVGAEFYGSSGSAAFAKGSDVNE